MVSQCDGAPVNRVWISWLNWISGEIYDNVGFQTRKKMKIQHNEIAETTEESDAEH